MPSTETFELLRGITLGIAFAFLPACISLPLSLFPSLCPSLCTSFPSFFYNRIVLKVFTKVHIGQPTDYLIVLHGFVKPSCHFIESNISQNIFQIASAMFAR
jgi:hypothetical protein